jgi:hypothetical protein
MQPDTEEKWIRSNCGLVPKNKIKKKVRAVKINPNMKVKIDKMEKIAVD